jgi:hypothetical protein
VCPKNVASINKYCIYQRIKLNTHYVHTDISLLNENDRIRQDSVTSVLTSVPICKVRPMALLTDVLRPPFEYGESTEKNTLGKEIESEINKAATRTFTDEIQTEINKAPARSFSDPQQKESTVTGSIPSSQPVLVSCDFQSEWSQANHPIDYPSNAHWSPIVLASHSEGYQMWSYGNLASRGVQEVAEVCSVAE